MVEARFRFEGRFVTGCRPSDTDPKVAPHFSLSELARKDKTHFIHPNLILALQNIRNLYDNIIRIVDVGENGRGARGLCATIQAANFAELRTVCTGFVENGAIASLDENGSNLFLEARPAPAETVSLEEALETAFYVTSGFEASGDPFQQVTGNFDEAGLSFGPSQVNFKTGTLVELFRRLEALDAAALKECFGGGADWEEWRGLWDKRVKDQIVWGNDHSIGAKKANVVEPWRSHLKSVGRVLTFRDQIKAYSKENYGKKLRTALKWLQTVWPHPITDLRCLCALFDLCTQQGSLNDAHDEIKARVETQRPTRQQDVVQIAVEERAKTATPKYRADCMTRRLGILHCTPVSASESGERAERDNPYFSLLPEMEVQGIEKFLES